ncbi:MAG: VTT domain-containing protein [Thermoproteota archaeon]|nr:VTT domain-containing protein [Thermoproteota archaeon]
MDIGILDVVSFISNIDYFAVFILTFVSAVLIFVPIPYFPILMTAVLVTSLDPNWIALYGALGAVAAKTIVFLLSYYGSIVSKPRKRQFNPEDYPETLKTIRKYGWLVVFLASVTPIPDNIIFIPLAMYRYNPLKFIAIAFVSKIVLNEVVVWGTVYLGRPLIGNFSEMTVDAFTLAVAVSVSVISFGVLFYLFLRINWSVSLERFLVRVKSLRKN